MNKPTDTHWLHNDEGDVICQYHGDPQRRTIAVPTNDFPLSAWQVASLMNSAFESGVRAKTAQIKMELGL
jgi:hypothetical protein